LITASGVRQKDIAEKVGLKEPAISKIVNAGNFPKESDHDINAISPTAEIDRLQKDLDKAVEILGTNKHQPSQSLFPFEAKYPYSIRTSRATIWGKSTTRKEI